MRSSGAERSLVFNSLLPRLTIWLFLGHVPGCRRVPGHIPGYRSRSQVIYQDIDGSPVIYQDIDGSPVIYQDIDWSEVVYPDIDRPKVISARIALGHRVLGPVGISSCEIDFGNQ